MRLRGNLRENPWELLHVVDLVQNGQVPVLRKVIHDFLLVVSTEKAGVFKIISTLYCRIVVQNPGNMLYLLILYPSRGNDGWMDCRLM